MSTEVPVKNCRSMGTSIKGWVQLSRPPFHLVGVFPFVLGALLAWHLHGEFHWAVFGWSTAAVVLIMLATYYSGEYYDLKGDILSAERERNAFSGGTQAIVNKLVPHGQARAAGYLSLVLAGMIGVVLYFYYRTGFWTIPLGVVGMMAGFFYSTPPIRWVKRGVGEILIGFCYGWLPVATSFYLQTGRVDSIVHWASIAIGCTIFNVILLNEFPDYPADVIEGKKNLVVRMGKRAAGFLYMAVSAAAWFAFVLSVNRGLPALSLAFYAPVFLISLALVFLVWRKEYLNRNRLESMCGLTIAVNLGTTLAYILGLWLGGA